MWRSRSDGDVTCIACGTEVPRSKAREYDRYGDRWGKRDRDFEFLCKPCYRECCHQPRKRLEDDLVRADAGTGDQQEFLARYHDVITSENPDRGREPERE
jgi:hypothetical protein